MTDAIGRSWQLGTVQLDYVMPERFELTYTGADNAEHRPVMIHRALMGSFERFIGMLDRALRGRVPGLAGAGPGDRAAGLRPPRRATPTRSRRRSAEFRVEVDERTESIGRKIREAELRKIPYMLVLGDREVESDTLSRAPAPRGRPGRAVARRRPRAKLRRRS